MTNPEDRFSSPSDVLLLPWLLGENRRVFYVAALMGVAALAALVFSLSQEKVQPVPKPLTMELVIRKPRMTKPFEFQKKPKPRRIMTRKQSEARPSKPTITQHFRNPNLFGTVMTFNYGIDTGASIGTEVVEPDIAPVAIVTSKEPEKRINMQTEFLDLNALDTGKYKGMVIQDPANKQNIRGFIYLGVAWGSVLRPANQRAIPQLVRSINQYTQINAEVDDQMFLDSRALFKTPFVYISASRSFELTQHEIENLAEYLRAGGFVLAENADAGKEYSPAEASLREMFKQALGREARFVPISNDHPLYHAFFDFDGPPPGQVLVGRNARQVNYLEGIFLRDRLVAVYSNKNYGSYWQVEAENEPQLKMGINFVIFALTQKGSIAQQQIDFYSEGG